jgi:hypothetical protein
VSLTPCTDFYRPVEELEYTDLLRSTFTQSGHERRFKTWRTEATHPQCVFCGKKHRWGKGEVECHMDPTITKASTVNERLVSACAESHYTSRDPNRTRFLAVQAVIRVKIQCDKKTLLVDTESICLTESISHDWTDRPLRPRRRSECAFAMSLM